MKGEEYIKTQMRLLEIGKIAESLDLDGFIKHIMDAEALGPILDPTLFTRAAGNLSAIKRLAQAVQPVKVVFAETFQEVLKTAVKEHERKQQ